jgi:mono/diheme cytochrome c family protein
MPSFYQTHDLRRAKNTDSMVTMKKPFHPGRFGRRTVALLLGAGISTVAFAQDEKVARGKYLVEEVARCQDCHTPKMDNGSYIKSQWMKGAAISMMPAQPVVGWKSAAPDVTPNGAIWKRWGEEGITTFLSTGKSPRGGRAAAPMPAYSLKKEDAEAVVAFLKSLQ